jgi:putative FmdB family regulatory protein
MPIYEYFCEKCGTFEVMQRITENPLKRCPTCRAKVERLVSRTSFVLKGSGWYATDYARSGSNSTGTRETGGAASSANGNSDGAATSPAASASNDAKPAAPADSKASSPKSDD